MVVVVLSTLNFFIYLFGTKETLQLEQSTPQAEKLEGELNKAVSFFFLKPGGDGLVKGF